MSPILRVITPILRNQVKKIYLHYTNFSGNNCVRFIPERQLEQSKINRHGKNPWMSLSDEEWRERLTFEEYEVTRKKATERPFTGKYCNQNEEGIYQCTCCSEALFSSKEKYDSGSGWPSFYSPVANKDGEKFSQVQLKTDKSYGMLRTEVVCGKCDAHLGHVFNDGPPPTGLRYCINSISLKFLPMSGAKNGTN